MGGGGGVSSYEFLWKDRELALLESFEKVDNL